MQGPIHRNGKDHPALNNPAACLCSNSLYSRNCTGADGLVVKVEVGLAGGKWAKWRSQGAGQAGGPPSRASTACHCSSVRRCTESRACRSSVRLCTAGSGDRFSSSSGMGRASRRRSVTSTATHGVSHAGPRWTGEGPKVKKKNGVSAVLQKKSQIAPILPNFLIFPKFSENRKFQKNR